MSTARRSPRWIARRSRSSPSCGSSCKPPARPSQSSAAWIPGRSPSSWSKSVTSAGSPWAGSGASTAPRRCPRRPPKDRASPCATATTRRQPPDQPGPAPHGDHSVALRAARPGDLRQRAREGTHQEGGPPGPQTTPIRRRLPPHDPRSSIGPCPAPPRRLTPRGRRAVKGGPTGPSASEPRQRHP